MSFILPSAFAWLPGSRISRIASAMALEEHLLMGTQIQRKFERIALDPLFQNTHPDPSIVYSRAITANSMHSVQPKSSTLVQSFTRGRKHQAGQYEAVLDQLCKGAHVHDHLQEPHPVWTLFKRLPHDLHEPVRLLLLLIEHASLSVLQTVL